MNAHRDNTCLTATVGQLVASSITAVGMHKPLVPAIPIESWPALRFLTVLIEKRRQRKAGLALDRIANHNFNLLILNLIPV